MIFELVAIVALVAYSYFIKSTNSKGSVMNVEVLEARLEELEKINAGLNSVIESSVSNERSDISLGHLTNATGKDNYHFMQIMRKGVLRSHVADAFSNKLDESQALAVEPNYWRRVAISDPNAVISTDELKKYSEAIAKILNAEVKA